jgi:hypothetical protein
MAMLLQMLKIKHFTLYLILIIFELVCLFLHMVSVVDLCLEVRKIGAPTARTRVDCFNFFILYSFFVVGK